MNFVKKIIIPLIVVVFLGSIGFLFYHETHFGESKKIVVHGTVTAKEYVPAKTTLMPISTGKSISAVPRHISAKYNLTVEYEGKTITIDSEAKYNSYEIGDSIPITLVTWYRKDSSIRRQFLTE